MQTGKVRGYKCPLLAALFIDLYNSEPRATCGQLAVVFQGLEKEEKAEGEHSRIILGSLYVFREVVGRMAICSFVHQFCVSMFR